VTTLTDSRIDSLFNWVNQSKGGGAEVAGGEKNFGALLAALETLGTAGFMAYMNAKHGARGRSAVEVGGIPADVVVGILGNVIGFSGYLGKYSEHAHNLGNGFLAAYFVRILMMWGADARAKEVIRMNAVEAARASATPAVGALPQLGMPGMPQNFAPTQYPMQPAATRQYGWAA
jgi:hypothetical protein